MQMTLSVVGALRSAAMVIVMFAVASGAGLIDVTAQSFESGNFRGFVDHSQGTNGAIIIYIPVAPLADYYRFIIPLTTGYPVTLRFDVYKQTVIFTTSTGKVVEVPLSAFEVVTVTSSAGLAKASPPGIAPNGSTNPGLSPVSIATSNDADTFAVSCDGRWAVVVGTSDGGNPVSLVDLSAATEVAKLSYPNQLSRAAAIGDDGQTVLVVLDNATASGASTIRRLALGTAGGLTDSGVQLAFGGNFVSKIAVAPGSKTGVALVQPSSGIGTRIVTFTLPTLTMQDSVNLAGNTGNSLAFDPTGLRVYARSGNRAATPDVIEAFDFNSVSGAISHAATRSISPVSGFTGSLLENPMAITPDGSRLIAAEEDARGELSAPRITEFSTSTGAIAYTFGNPGLSTPQTVATVPACALAPPPVTAPDLNQHGLTGSYYEPANSGQGLEIEVYPNPASGTGSTFVSWFTYDTVIGGAERQRWYTAQGQVVTGQPIASLTIYQNTGGSFNAPPVTNALAVGTATMSFSTCTSGELAYNFTDGTGRTGNMPLTRLTQNVTCSTTTPYPTNADFALSGNWYGGAATSGQGFTAEVNPNSGAFFAAWYTYMPNGTATGAAGQRWYTAQGAFTPGMRSIPVTIYETTGGVFDTATPPGQKTVAVGTGIMTFQNCLAATFSYNFTGGTSTGLSGNINLSRVGPVPPGCPS